MPFINSSFPNKEVFIKPLKLQILLFYFLAVNNCTILTNKHTKWQTAQTDSPVKTSTSLKQNMNSHSHHDLSFYNNTLRIEMCAKPDVYSRTGALLVTLFITVYEKLQIVAFNWAVRERKSEIFFRCMWKIILQFKLHFLIFSQSGMCKNIIYKYTFA